MLKKIDENILLFDSKYLAQKKYWTEKLSGDLVPTILPPPFPVEGSRQEAREVDEPIDYEIVIGGGIYGDLMKLARSSDLSLFIILLSALKLLVYRYSGNRDICVLSPVYQPKISHETLNEIVFIRDSVGEEATFKELIITVRDSVLDAYKNQDYPHEKLVESLFPQASPSCILCRLKNIHPNGDGDMKKNRLTFDFLRTDENIRGWVRYDTEAYRESEISRIAGHFLNLLTQAIVNTGLGISHFEFLTEIEKKHLLVDLSGRRADFPREKTIHHFIEGYAVNAPHHTAVSSANSQLTYKELNERSNRLGHLLKNRGVTGDHLVGVLFRRSLEMVTGILGIWKSGGAYVPMAVDFPMKRIKSIIADSQMKILLTKSSDFPGAVGFYESLSEAGADTLVYLDQLDTFDNDPTGHIFDAGAIESCKKDNLPRSVDLSAPVYIIYTSGSTGNPKGVIIEHTGMMNHIHAKINYLGITAGGILAQNASHTFDISVWQFFAAMVAGGRTVIYPRRLTIEAGKLKATIIKDQVTVLEVVPSYLAVLLEELGNQASAHGKLGSLEYLLVTGEEVPPGLVEKWLAVFPGVKLVNAYGPTEASDDITHHIMEKPTGRERVPIGTPLPNLCIYILDRHMNLCPPGLVGEICVAGIGVGRGYLNQPEKTAEVFGKNPFNGLFNRIDLPRLYKTGDLGAWLPGGELMFLGRKDYQVKIRGFRIEPGEIENRLVSHPSVREAVVIDRQDPDDNKYLCAYVTGGEEIEVSHLKEFLENTLPHYMIPAYIIVLANFPLTSHGKIDRKALPEPGRGPGSEIPFVTPQTPLEKKLAEIWARVLGREKVGREDNFFMMGGDSIKTIQVASRMNVEGYRVEMKDIFSNPTIARLTPLVKKVQRTPPQGEITGEVPLTPVQREFFLKHRWNRHHFNLSLMLYARSRFDPRDLETVFPRLLEHHDALRMTYREGEAGIIQYNPGPEPPGNFSLEVHDLRSLPGGAGVGQLLREKIEAVQENFDLTRGPLFKPVLFQLDDGDRLLLAAHHLVMDGISWRVVLEDFQTLYRQYRHSESLSLPLKSDSFKQWAEKLSEYAKSGIFLEDSEYWERSRLECTATPLKLKTDFEGGNLVKDTETVEFSLDPRQTDLLLTRVNEAYGTGTDDILLTALAMSTKEIEPPGAGGLLIALESHGRENIPGDLDVNRTVGWFTAVYPVLLKVGSEPDPGRRLKEVKETLRHVPRKGLGYGILKYLVPGSEEQAWESEPQPQVGFNYLGQVDTDINRGEGEIELAAEPLTANQHMELEREYALEVTAVVKGSRLWISVSYSRRQFRRETLELLASRYREELNRLISHCSSKKERELTPSDLTYPRLSVHELEQLEGQYRLEDIYSLSPMQEGMYFHSRENQSSSVYFEQFSYRIDGELDLDLLKKSLEDLLKRYDILRTVFIQVGTHRPLQAVLKECRFELDYMDISGLGEKQKEARIIEYREEDRRRGFDLAKGPAIRAGVLRLQSNHYEFAWSFHHLLMDGWCLGILLRDFSEMYRSYRQHASPQLPPVTQYKIYIRWLEKQDTERSKKYWGKYLAGYDELAGIGCLKDKAGAGKSYKSERYVFPLGEEVTRRLKALASRHQVTLNILVQTLWAIQLGIYTGKRDVVFGVVVSGRPGEIPGVETMVGLFINTIPVRIHFHEKTTFSHLLARVRDDAVESAYHHYISMADTRSVSPLKQELADHILAFENYPVGALLGELPFEVSGIEIFEESNYDFNVAVVPGEGLQIVFVFNSNEYKIDMVKKIASHLELLAEQVVINPGIDPVEMSLLTGKEKQRLLIDLNHPAAGYPSAATLHDIFAEQVRLHPDRIAVKEVGKGGVQESYRELNRHADRLAHTLREKGVIPGTIAALALEPSRQIPEGILAVLKAGGTYLPLDPSYPEERNRYILEDSRAPFLLTTSRYLDRPLAFRGERMSPVLKSRQTGPYVTEVRPPIQDFDALPPPDRSLVDYEKYTRHIGIGSVKNSISLQATRGCPYNCAYCHKIWPKSHQVRSAENIFAEVSLYYKMGIHRFVFVDDIFNIHRENSSRFFRLVLENGLKPQFFFSNGIRGDLLTRDYIDLMVEAGTVSAALALETASPRLQKLVGKNLDTDKLRENLEYFCREYPQVILELFTMHGFPTETETEARMTLDFIKDLKWLHFPYVHILKIFPGSDMEKLALENGVSAEAIFRSSHLAYHQLPTTLPFEKSFTLKYQADFTNNYFLDRQRLLHVLPHQLRLLSEDEMVRKYDSYLPVEIRRLEDLLELVGISRQQLTFGNGDEAGRGQKNGDQPVLHLNRKIKAHFKPEKTGAGALKVLLLDLSQDFTAKEPILYDVVEAPLGLMYVMTYLKKEFPGKIAGKIAKSRIDFDSYGELRTLVEEFKPGIIGIRTLSYYRDFFHATLAIIRRCGFTGPVAAGGPYATTSYQSLLQDRNVDLAVLGEGEVTFAQVIGAVLANGGALPGEDVLKGIPGIAFIPASQKNRAAAAAIPRVILMDYPDLASGTLPGPAPLSPVRPQHPAYIIYTSGTTGKPKGVLIEHRNVVRLMKNDRCLFQFTQEDVWTLFHSYNFDFSVWEMYGALLFGGKLIVVPPMLARDPAGFLDLMKKECVTVLNQTPQSFYNLASEELRHPAVDLHLRYVIFGGDALNPLKLKEWEKKYPFCRLVNMFGITETTVHVTYKQIGEPEIAAGTSNIGKPLPAWRVYVLDSRLRLMPDGVPGELYVGGGGVARGYLNRVELTAAFFVRDPFKTGDRLYRSGDRVRWLDNGDMEYLGRIDFQVKIRGYRIEPSEIENRLLGYPGVRATAVVCRQETLSPETPTLKTDGYLCAYMEVEGEVSVTGIREYLVRHLPPYMIPAYFVTLDKLPLTPNKKIQRRGLPDPRLLRPDGESRSDLPGTALESLLVKTWQEVLGGKEVGIHDDFFTIGGDSIKTLRIASRLREEGYKLEMRDLFRNPTIATLAPLVKKISQPLPLGEVIGPVPLTPIQQWFFENHPENSHHYNLPVILYSRERLEEEGISAIFTKIQEHHDALRMVFKRDKEEILQINRGQDHPLWLRVFDYRRHPDALGALEAQADEIQASINLETGPLMKLGLFHLDDGDRLLMVIHHLVIDGVSWRILFEDIEMLYRRYREQTPLELPPKTHSFKSWAEKLAETTGNRSEFLLKEKSYWEELSALATEPLSRDFPGEHTVKNSMSLTFSLGPEETGRLLTRVHEAFNTKMNDILLTALGLALRETFACARVLIFIEGHGREKLPPADSRDKNDLDINRTVGWFTTLYPVLLEMTYEDDLARQIMEVKEHLHRVPNRGMGYGMLRYLAPKEFQVDLYRLTPQISFNYLGQFGEDAARMSQFEIARERMGSPVSPAGIKPFDLDISGIVAGKQLEISVSFSPQQYKVDRVEEFTAGFNAQLVRIIDFCSDRLEKLISPSDLGYSDISIEEFNDFFDSGEIR